jgi:hypothetical protein
MSFTPEQRAKAAATRAANKAAREAKQAKKAAKAVEALAEVATLDGAPTDSEARLLAEIDELKAKLGVAESKRGEAETAALASAQAQGALLQGRVEEVPTGKTIKVQRLDKYKEVGYRDDGRPILKPIFKTVEIPTYFYKVDMPPCGGSDLKINGVPFYHGVVYELDLDSLRTVKEMVYRTWDHDRQIHGSDESFYRGKHMDMDPRNRMSARGMS